MKKLKINQKENLEAIELMDNDDSNLDEYSKKISSIFESNNIVILKTDNDSVIIRPQSISSISISEIEENVDSHTYGENTIVEDVIEPMEEIKEIEVKEKEDIIEDIITELD